jgi:hypothetical protein
MDRESTVIDYRVSSAFEHPASLLGNELNAGRMTLRASQYEKVVLGVQPAAWV